MAKTKNPPTTHRLFIELSEPAAAALKKIRVRPDGFVASKKIVIEKLIMEKAALK